jgi:hypothetical protein
MNLSTLTKPLYLQFFCGMAQSSANCGCFIAERSADDQRGRPAIGPQWVVLDHGGANRPVARAVESPRGSG